MIRTSVDGMKNLYNMISIFPFCFAAFHALFSVLIAPPLIAMVGFMSASWG
jgi:hypothetical protein